MRRKESALSLVGVPRELTDDDLGAIIQMARERAALVGDMRTALEAGDDHRALALARKVAGLEEEIVTQ
jgi:hypothetical protein